MTRALWADPEPIRAELLSTDRLSELAYCLAAEHQVASEPKWAFGWDQPLAGRLADNARCLLQATATLTAAASGRAMTPAAEWLIDNYHLVNMQIQEIGVDLPRRYYSELPKLAHGAFADLPRVFAVTWALIAHTDSQFEPETLCRYLQAYQTVQPLTIGELWAVPITLRIVLIENLRRLAQRFVQNLVAREDADRIADQLLSADGHIAAALPEGLAQRGSQPYPDAFVVQLAHRLRAQDPHASPLRDWLEQRLAHRGTSTQLVVEAEQQRQGAAAATVRNIISGLRLAAAIDWTEAFERVCLIDDVLALDTSFRSMDFPTRNLYRRAVEELSRGSGLSEPDIARRAAEVAAAERAALPNNVDTARRHDPGYTLLDGGRAEFEAQIGFRPPFRSWFSRLCRKLGIGGYGATVIAVALIFEGAALWCVAAAGSHLSWGWLWLLGILGVVGASDAAVACVNRLAMRASSATPLPGLELRDGIPPELRTLVAVPTLLTSAEAIDALVASLEIHHLASQDGSLHFALLSDWTDSATEHTDDDAALLQVAANGVDRLNVKYPSDPGGLRFLLLHRRRVWNEGEGRWIGWERKRGKLHELNRLLRGAVDTTYLAGPGDVPAGVRYVLTLDADTRLPREAVRRLVGKMAHPLGAPLFDPVLGRVVAGHGVLQPRVTPSLPVGRDSSLFQRVFSSMDGIDAYAAAVSDVYQDLFGEGSYAGKGIYEIDSFEQSLAGRVPASTMLSHDLFEGVFARAGLSSDVEVIEEYPAAYAVSALRQHRWARGDWQILPWLLPWLHSLLPAPSPAPVQDSSWRTMPAIGRWKLLDNLRRTMVAPCAVLALLAGWMLPFEAALAWTGFVLATLAVPTLLPVIGDLQPGGRWITWRIYFGRLGASLSRAAALLGLTVAFLAHQGWMMSDAILRTLTRLFVTRRHLLQWVTAAQSADGPALDLAHTYARMAGGAIVGGVAIAAAVLAPTGVWLIAMPFAVAWITSPAIAWRISRTSDIVGRGTTSQADIAALRQTARQTWRFFETFVTPAENNLPPDNFQEDPAPVVAHRTSPTNIGLYLLSAVCAHDFGWIGRVETVERLEATLATMGRLERYRGHFYNWYDTTDLRPLDPRYVSTVDSGNLAGHLIAVANACAAWRLLGLSVVRGGDDTRPNNAADATDRTYWAEAARRKAASHARDRDATQIHDLIPRLAALEASARGFALGMEFGFLRNPFRKLLSIGYLVEEGVLDLNCYDLLASEARLAVFFAIAKGDVPAREWFRLGRAVTPIETGAALVSWSGSMFEYLMPSLVMRAPTGSLLDQTTRLVVQRQIAVGKERGIPWGVSESAYNVRDIEYTYQYSNFGIPGLGLKRGLGDDHIVAPYATALAAMIDPKAAVRNLAVLEQAGGLGHYGFYEALDYTRSRLAEGQAVAIVRTSMAHHQGMTIVAIADAVLETTMRSRFHAEPMIQATELLLQERAPRRVTVARTLPFQGPPAATNAPAAPSGRRFATARCATPVTHLLSNGRYTVMVTSAGSGYSRWNDIAITRWREDPTLDDWGTYIYLRDTRSGQVWSAGLQPCGVEPDGIEVAFSEDRAEFARRDGSLTTGLDILVSSEEDAEVRRVSVTNSGSRTREIELTSYGELALAGQAADVAHPAFSKLFVETEFLVDQNAILATRRLRTPDEKPIWVAHMLVADASTIIPGSIAVETDRARFLGRGRDGRNPAALSGAIALSGTVGTVLDAVFSLRCRIAIPPGGTVRVAFWTMVAASREMLLVCIDRHRDTTAFDRASTLAWTQAQVQLRHLGIRPADADLFQRLAAHLVFTNPALRPPADAIRDGMGPQSGLWAFGISGDRPILLLRIGDVLDIELVEQVLLAHEYFCLKRLAVDVVIVNEHAASYAQDLQVAIEGRVRAQSRLPTASGHTMQGAVFVLRSEALTAPTAALLAAAARVVLHCNRGSLFEQLDRSERPVPNQLLIQMPPTPAYPIPSMPELELQFFNGLGGFSADGREYVVTLGPGQTTPAPWINVIANPAFGFHVAADGAGMTWSGNSRENQLTPWSNDPVTDRAGEAVYLRDDEAGILWSPTAAPLRNAAGSYRAWHGRGYSRFAHEANGIASTLVQFVPVDAPVKISRLQLHNRSGRPRMLSICAYVEWVLGASRAATAGFVSTEIDPETGALFARNRWRATQSGAVAFCDLRGRQTSWTGDRAAFIGRIGTLRQPLALAGKAALSNIVGGGLDACGALLTTIRLAPGEQSEIVFLLGEAENDAAARSLVLQYRTADLDACLAEVGRQWEGVLGAVQVRTPDPAMDLLLNGWLLYQTLACRVWARAAFYQASGAYGFRDQLQDCMALVATRPDLARAHLLRAAGRQFVEGDVQHWWLPPAGAGVRTRISDDRAWLATAVAHYVTATADATVLDEVVPFLAGPSLADGEHDLFFTPGPADEQASLFAHCARALDHSLAVGGHGLPLMGTGDWNDGMSAVGAAGHGESVWLGWFLHAALSAFAPLAEARGDFNHATAWRTHADALAQALDAAWDGGWYLRAWFDDGTPLGAAANPACRIDSIAQSWAVLSGAAQPDRAATAMAALRTELVQAEPGLVLVLTPPFDATVPGAPDPGYIKGYPPGIRENGGQYTHAALWAVMAFASLGEGDEATRLFAMLNPINHARTPTDVTRYKLEPYVVAADVYSTLPHIGRGGWSWYTGSAGWMQRAGIESILGLRIQGSALHITPCIPNTWPGFEATIKWRTARYYIIVENKGGAGSKVITLDDAVISNDAEIPLQDDGSTHTVHVKLC